MAWRCLELEVCCLFQSMTSRAHWEDVAHAALQHRRALGRMRTARWYANNRTVANERDRYNTARRNHENPERMRRQRQGKYKRWMAKLRADPQRYEAWKAKQREKSRHRRRP